MKRLTAGVFSISIISGLLITSVDAQTVVPLPEASVAVKAQGQDHLDESWTSLSREGSHLVAASPLVIEKDVTDNFTREMIRVQWRDLDPFYLYVLTPVGKTTSAHKAGNAIHRTAKSEKPKTTKRFPVVLYQLSFPQETDSFINEAFCNLLVKNNVAAVGFAGPLTGERYHDRPMK